MVVIQGKSKKKESGAPYKSFRRKRTYEKGSLPTLTKLGEKKSKTVRTRGGNKKTIYRQADHVNLYVPKENKFYRVTIKAIVENAANRHFVRRNVLTKGSIIDTEKGKARITSRPGQHGTMNAILQE